MYPVWLVGADPATDGVEPCTNVAGLRGTTVFDAADCLFKDRRFAVLVARRAAGAS